MLTREFFRGNGWRKFDRMSFVARKLFEHISLVQAVWISCKESGLSPVNEIFVRDLGHNLSGKKISFSSCWVWCVSGRFSFSHCFRVDWEHYASDEKGYITTCMAMLRSFLQFSQVSVNPFWNLSECQACIRGLLSFEHNQIRVCSAKSLSDIMMPTEFGFTFGFTILATFALHWPFSVATLGLKCSLAHLKMHGFSACIYAGITFLNWLKATKSML